MVSISGSARFFSEALTWDRPGNRDGSGERKSTKLRRLVRKEMQTHVKAAVWCAGIQTHGTAFAEEHMIPFRIDKKREVSRRENGEGFATMDLNNV